MVVDGSIDVFPGEDGKIEEIHGQGVICLVDRVGDDLWFITLTRPDQTREMFRLKSASAIEVTEHKHFPTPTTGPNVEPWTLASKNATPNAE